MVGYKDVAEHLADEFALLDRRLSLLLGAPREREGAEDELAAYRGLVVTQTEVARMLGSGAATAAATATASREELAALQAAEARRMERRQNSHTRLMPLFALTKRFRLTPQDELALTACLAVEIDSRYEKLFGYAQDDVTRRRPTVQLVLDLAGQSGSGRLAGLEQFSPGAPLLKYGLLRTGEASLPLAARALEIDADLVAFLTGQPHLPPGVVVGPQPDPDRAKGLLGDTASQQLIRWLGLGQAPPILVLHGPPGSGRRTVAAALAAAIDSSLWMVQGGDADLLRIGRDAFLQHAGLGAVAGDDLAGVKRLVEVAGTFGLPLFLWSDRALEPHLFRNGRLAQVAVPLADQPVREQIWLELLAKVPHAADVEPAALAAAYRLTPGRIQDAFWLGREQAWLRSPDGVLAQADLVAGCKAQSSARLGTLARRLNGRPSWDALVLPQEQLEQLAEFCDWVRYRYRVLKEWGFGDGQSRGLGISALFAGGSGTGKTLAAEAVATKLGVDLYRIDLSAVVSKYIGETEKNLAQVFDAAEESHALLFFDEADSLFGKRTEVKDAHDRYANIEINYLLQRMEAFDGLTVLATNRVEDLDEAFKRRLSFQISFPMPDQLHRRRIWQVHLPASAPLAPDVDLDFLAARLAVPGGNIRNIALGAAFLAAADGGPISMLHLVRAARREYEKAGRPCTEREFGPYLPLIQRERR